MAITFRTENKGDVVISEDERSVLAQQLRDDVLLPHKYIKRSIVVHCDAAGFKLETKEGQVPCIFLYLSNVAGTFVSACCSYHYLQSLPSAVRHFLSTSVRRHAWT